MINNLKHDLVIKSLHPIQILENFLIILHEKFVGEFTIEHKGDFYEINIRSLEAIPSICIRILSKRTFDSKEQKFVWASEINIEIMSRSASNLLKEILEAFQQAIRKAKTHSQILEQ